MTLSGENTGIFTQADSGWMEKEEIASTRVQVVEGEGPDGTTKDSNQVAKDSAYGDDDDVSDGDQETVGGSVQDSMCSSQDDSSLNVAVDGTSADRDNKVDLSRLVPKKSTKPNLVSKTPTTVPKKGSSIPKVDHAKIKWEKPEWAVKPKLKATAQGEVVKQGADLQSPITQVNATKEYEVAVPVVKTVVEKKKEEEVKWEKPEWTRSPQLKSTKLGEAVKSGQDIASPISNRPKLGNTESSIPLRLAIKAAPIEWETPEWATNPVLKSTGKGEAVKVGACLQKPITHVEKDTTESINFEANPMILKTTEQGSAVRFGENLAKPITNIERDPMGDINFEANPTMLQESTTGRAVKEGVSLARPITFPKKCEASDANFEANPAMLKVTDKGSVIRQGAEIARPITFPNGKTCEDEEDFPVGLESNYVTNESESVVDETIVDETETEDIVEVLDDDEM